MRRKHKIKEQALLSTNEFIEVISKSFKKYIEKDYVDKHPAVFVQGQPGIGKSDSIKQIAKLLEAKTNKRVYVKDVRLLLYTPIDLNGIPVPNLEKKEAIWLTPEIFKLNPDEDVINILFLDELTSASKSIQTSAYQIALNKQLGDHKLPKNTFIIAAGNRPEDGSNVYDMPDALKNRFMSFELSIDAKGWLKWARKNNINQDIIKFIEENPDQLSTQQFDTDEQIVVTPRSWELLSRQLDILEMDIKEAEIYANSIIGKSLTTLILNSEKIEKVDIEKIYKNGLIEPPKKISSLDRIVTQIENDLDKIKEDVNIMINVLTFMNNIPIDFSLRLLRSIIKNRPQNYKLEDIEIYQQLILDVSDKL